MTNTDKPVFKRYDVTEQTKVVLHCNPYLENQLAKVEESRRKWFLDRIQDKCNELMFNFLSKTYTLQNYEEVDGVFHPRTMHVEIVCGEPIMVAPLMVDRILSLRGENTQLHTRNGKLDFGQKVNEYGYLEFYIFWHGWWS